MKSPAIVLANRLFKTPNGKVAHGLIRGSDRFRVTAVVDPDCAGEDAGEALDGQRRDIPIVAGLDEALSVSEQTPAYCVVGIATHGGRFTDELRASVVEAVKRGLSIVNGLHDAASEDAEIAAAAEAAGVELIDLRKSPAKRTLPSSTPVAGTWGRRGSAEEACRSPAVANSTSGARMETARARRARLSGTIVTGRSRSAVRRGPGSGSTPTSRGRGPSAESDCPPPRTPGPATHR